MRSRINRLAMVVGVLAPSFAQGCSGSDGQPGGSDTAAATPVVNDVGEVSQAAIVGTLVNPTPVYSGIWSTIGAASETLRFNRTAAELAADFSSLTASGLRLNSLTSNVVNEVVRYSAIWNPGFQPQALRTGLTQSQFETEYVSLFFLGYRLGSLTTYNVGGQLRVSAVFNASLANEVYTIGRTQSLFVTDILGQALLGNQPVSVAATVVGAQTFFSVIYRPSPVLTHVRVNQTFSQFLTERSNMAVLGHRLISLAITAVDGVAYYHSIFAPSLFADDVTSPLAQVAFGNVNGGERSSGFRLTQIVANVESLNLTKMADGIRDTLTPASTGFATTLAVGTTRERRVGGFRRTSTDAPQRTSTNTDVMNLASVSKLITGAAVQRALADNTGPNTTLDSPMSVWLPASWVRGPGVTAITMRELLTHRSGFRYRNPPAPDPDDYAGLQSMVAQGIKPENKGVPEYVNHNFGLFRIIVPYLTGYTGTGNIDLETRGRFLSYVNTKIITPSGAGVTSPIPPTFEPTLFYTFPSAGIPGTEWGDGSAFVGGGALHLSSDQLATVLVQRYSAAVLGPALAVEQDNGMLGWDSPRAVRHGTSRVKGGYLYRDTPSNGRKEDNTLAISICQDAVPTPTTCFNGVHVGLLVNSRVATNMEFAVVNAYDASWMTTY